MMTSAERTQAFLVIILMAAGAVHTPFLYAAPEQQVPPPAAEDAKSPQENVEVILSTLNETLEENRKIRENMKAMQTALDQSTTEKDSLKKQIKDFETLALQKTSDLKSDTVDLQKKLDQATSDKEKFEMEKKTFDARKEAIRKTYKKAINQNRKLKAEMEKAILPEERDRLVGDLKRNRESIERAAKTLSELTFDNEKMKDVLESAYYQLGNLNFQLHNYEAAKIYYEKVLEWDPANAWTHHNLAVTYDYYLNNRAQALAHYQKFLDSKPEDAKASEIKQRMLDLNFRNAVSPHSDPLKADFDRFHKNN